MREYNQENIFEEITREQAIEYLEQKFPISILASDLDINIERSVEITPRKLDQLQAICDNYKAENCNILTGSFVRYYLLKYVIWYSEQGTRVLNKEEIRQLPRVTRD